jgi:hypothetical protein
MFDKWSQSFASSASFDALIFMIGGAAVTFIALTIIGLNAMKVVEENPVNELRSKCARSNSKAALNLSLISLPKFRNPTNFVPRDQFYAIGF